MEIIKFIGTYIQLLTFAVSVFTYFKYQHTVLKWLPFYLGLFAIVELICYHFYQRNNVWVYNMLAFIQLNFHFWILYHYLVFSWKKVIAVILIIFNLFYIGSFVFGLNDFFKGSSTFGFVIGGMLVMGLLLMVLGEMTKVKKSKGILRNVLFWFCFSILVSYSISIPVFAVKNWSTVLQDFQIDMIRILFSSILLSHLLLNFGLLWSKKKFTY